jgi:TonB family protein
MIKAVAVLLVARLVIPRLRFRSAAERHLLWASALGLAAILPVLAAVVPVWQPAWARTALDFLPTAYDRLSRWTRPSDAIVVRAEGLEGDGWMAGAALFVWAGGTLLATALLALQWLRVRRLAAQAVPVTDVRLLQLSAECARAAGLAQAPRLLQSGRAPVPLTWGFVRPLVLLPAGITTWSAERLRAVSMHEMAHIRRGDWAVHVSAELICAAYWFNPLCWVARNELRRESERAADDAVLRAGVDGRDYAALLVDVIRRARAPAPAPTVAMARPSDLAARITSIVDPSPSRFPVHPRTTLAAAVLVVVAASGLAAFRPPDVAAYIQVRTARLPESLLAAMSSPGAAAAATAVRNVRLVSPEPSAVPPEIIEYTTPPLYSEDARQRAVEGVVVIRARIDADGRVSRPYVISGVGFGLDQNAVVALRQWRFRPASRGGQTFAADVQVEIEFNLRQEALNELIANDMATQVGPGVTPPRAVYTVQPPPGTDRSGRVVLDVVLLEDGRPRIVRVLRSAGSDLDDVAVSTFEQWRFSPAVRDGVPVKVRMTAEVRFDA